MIKIAIDPGHGNGNRRGNVYDPGACAGNVTEADIVLQWGITLNWVLRTAGYDTWMTRDDDRDLDPVVSRASRAKEAGCTHFISLHCNAGPILANGTETLFRDRSTKDADKWIRQCHGAALAAVGRTNRGLKHESQSQHGRLAVLSFPGRACLVELGFITNPTDRKILLSRDARVKFAETLLKELQGR